MLEKNINIAINGFGRIGRLVARIIDGKNIHYKLKRINGTMRPEVCAHLLKFDSIYGAFDKEITYDENSITIDGNRKIAVTNDVSKESINWEGIDLIIDSSGKNKTKASLKKHIDVGAKKVIVTSPVSDLESVVVFGANESNYSNDYEIISTSSCTTNCAAPLLKMLNEKFSVDFASLTTVHAYTNDQNLLDSNHKDLRRSRSASRSMIPTTTGSSKEIIKILPEFKNKIICNAIRVPSDSVSLIDMVYSSKSSFTEEELKSYMIDYCNSNTTPISYTELPLVSVDLVKNTNSAVIDIGEVKSINNHSARILAWYDNEYGFACRVIDLIDMMVKNWI